MNKLQNLLINPYFLALIVGGIILYFLPPLFEKYNVVPIKKYYEQKGQQYFHDLDHDGKSEWIELANNGGDPAFPYLQCWHLNGLFERKWIEQINWTKPFIPGSRLIIGDYNGDDNDEVFVFVSSSDSLFLQVISPIEQKKVISTHFVSKVTFRETSPDFFITNGGLYDLNRDGFKEVVFMVTAGFSKIPRAVFAVDIQNKNILKSNSEYAHLMNGLDVYQDSERTIFLPHYCATTFNVNKEKNGFTDYNAWLMAFNENLELLFAPPKAFGEKSSIVSVLKKEGDSVFIYAYIKNGYDYLDWRIDKYSLDGNQISSITPPKGYTSLFKNLKGDIERVWIGDPDRKTIMEINRDLSIGVKHQNVQVSFSSKCSDLNGDNRNELFYFDSDRKGLFIVAHDFSHMALIKNVVANKDFILSEIELGVKKHYFGLSVNNELLIGQYTFNPLYYFKYVIYSGIYLSLIVFFIVIFRVQKRILQKRFEQEKHQLELELITIKNQIDPHFTFNAINTISALIYDKESEKAHRFLVDFSNLIRNTLRNSKKNSIQLKDEVEFVQKYLNLQQIRYKNIFNFYVESSGEVDWEVLVPRMIIQTFAENAVKHGLLPKKGSGTLRIIIKSQGNELEITVADDGIGREAAKQKNERSTGRGLDIIEQIVNMYNKLHKTKVSYMIIDLSDESGNSIGTKVVIKIPMK